MGDFMPVFFNTCIALGLLMILIGVAYVVWGQVALRKKRKYFADLHEQIAPGKDIMFCGGMFGTIKAVHGDTVQVKIREGVVDVSRYAIQEVK